MPRNTREKPEYWTEDDMDDWMVEVMEKTTDELVGEVANVLGEYSSPNGEDYVTADTFDEMNSLFIGNTSPIVAKGANPATTAREIPKGVETLAEIYEEYDIPTAESDDEPLFADLIGIVTGDGVAPILVVSSFPPSIMKAVERIGETIESAGGGGTLITDGGVSDVPRERLCISCREREGKPRAGRQMLCDICFHNINDADGVVSGAEEAEEEPEHSPTDISSDFTTSSSGDRTPPELQGNRKWLNWALTDDRKIPRNPAEGDPMTFTSAYAEDEWMSYEKASQYAEMVPNMDGLSYAMVEGDGYTLIDLDDVRNPETGETIPAVQQILEQTNSFAEVSTSGTGIHVIVKGDIPDEFGSPTIDLPGHPAAEMEVYPTKRFVAFTEEHVDGTPNEVNDAGEWLQYVTGWYVGSEEQQSRRKGAGEEWEPDYDRDDLGDIETTSDYKAVRDAIKQVEPRDIRLRSTKTEESSDGRMSFDPTWASSKSGTRLGFDPSGPGWIWRKGSRSIDALTIVACEEGIATSIEDDLEGEDFWDAVEALRQRGAHIPEYEPPQSRDPDVPRAARVLLPDYTQGEHQMGWWTRDQTAPDVLDQTDIYAKTEAKLDSIMDFEDAACLWGMMGVGKTHSTFKVAKERGEAFGYFCARGDMYDQAVEKAQEVGFEFVPFGDRTEENTGDIHVMPSMFRDCPCACGEHGDELADRLRRLHSRGASPKMIHAMLDLPCDDDDVPCPYFARCEIDPDNYDVIIGHYKHSHLPYITSDRHCVFDENPSDAFTSEVHGEQLVTSINTFLGFEESPPFDDFNDLIANRDDEERIEQTEAWFDHHELEPDEKNVMRHEELGYHAMAPYAVWTILHADPVGEDTDKYQCVIPNEMSTAVYFEGGESHGHAVRISTPPRDGIRYANAIIALDGTPLTIPDDHPDSQRLSRVPEWSMALGRNLNLRRVLSDEERMSFLHDTQGIRVVQTTDAVKPYSSGNYHNWNNDAAVLEAAGEVYGHGKPVAITTKKVKHDYQRQEGADDLVDEWDHYGNVRGSNRYASNRLGVLLGSPHHGDHALEMRAAMLGREVTPEGKGVDRDYGNDIANGLLQEMRESAVAQAALRFGRDGGGAIVMIHTSAIPDWMPVDAKGEVVQTWTKAQRSVIKHLNSGRRFTAKQLAEKDDVDVGRRQVQNILSGLEDRGVVRRKKDPDDGRKIQWSDAGLESAPVYGEASLPEVETASSVTEAVDEVSRRTTYTANFVNPDSDSRHIMHDSAVRGYDDGGDTDDDGPPPS